MSLEANLSIPTPGYSNVDNTTDAKSSQLVVNAVNESKRLVSHEYSDDDDDDMNSLPKRSKLDYNSNNNNNNNNNDNNNNNNDDDDNNNNINNNNHVNDNNQTNNEEDDDELNKKSNQNSIQNCPYLDTINRSILDFDFEKLCSVSLTNNNVYACLVCGKYFQGRRKQSHASTHSVQYGHHVYLNLHTQRFYCLPDNYEIIDTSLADVRYQLDPLYTRDQIKQIDVNGKWSRSLSGVKYLPGVVGMNNIKANDFMNVVLQALAHVKPIRNYFLMESNYINIKRPPGDKLFVLIRQMGVLMRKLWNAENFKSHVSPHEMLQAVVHTSNKRFQITKQGDALEFLAWLLNSQHRALGGTKKTKSSIIYKTFQGRMKVYSRKLATNQEDPLDELNPEHRFSSAVNSHEASGGEEICEENPFLFLTLDLPSPPLFHDETEKNIIPQVPLNDLLKKFDGTTCKEYMSYKETISKRFELTSLPKFLILYIKRFTKNIFYTEKNPTIVNFPIKELDMSKYLSPDPVVQLSHPYTKYNLAANIVHDGQPEVGKGTYRIHIQHRGAKQWFELQDLHVTDLMPQMISLSESYIQIYELSKEH